MDVIRFILKLMCVICLPIISFKPRKHIMAKTASASAIPSVATKPVNKIKATIKGHSPLDEVLLNMTETLCNKLDAKRSSADQDTGQVQGAQGDVSLRIVLGQLCGVIHRQVYGVITRQDNSQISNLTDRIRENTDRLDNRIEAMIQRYGVQDFDMMSDTECLRLMDIIERDQARKDYYDELFLSFKTAYLEATGEQWQPFVQGQQPVRTVIVDEAKKAMAEAALARLAAKKQAVA